MLGFLLEQSHQDQWVYRRHPAIARPLDEVGALTSDGVPFVRPEIALLFKAKATRFKDQRDLDRVLPRLDGAARAWLGSALEEAHPGHAWLSICSSIQRSEGPQLHRIEIVPYDPAWREQFAGLGCELRGGLGDIALRIDHIGSTSVPGLAAKPIIDIQVSVAAFEPLAAFNPRGVAAGGRPKPSGGSRRVSR